MRDVSASFPVIPHAVSFIPPTSDVCPAWHVRAMAHLITPGMDTRSVHMPSAGVTLAGELRIPAAAKGIVLFSQACGREGFSFRDYLLGEEFHAAGLATLMFDLLTPGEESVDVST